MGFDMPECFNGVVYSDLLENLDKCALCFREQGEVLDYVQQPPINTEGC